MVEFDLIGAEAVPAEPLDDPLLLAAPPVDWAGRLLVAKTIERIEMYAFINNYS